MNTKTPTDARPVGAYIRRSNGTLAEVPAYYRADDFMSATRELSPAETEAICHRVGRNNGPAAVFDLYFQSLITDETLGVIIGGVWASAEFPTFNLYAETWIDWFRTVGVRNASGQPVAAPSSIQIFRGTDATESIEGATPGMSWTTDRCLATWFATDYRRIDAPVLLSTTATAPAVLADLRDGDRSECEIVVDPSELSAITATPIPANFIEEAGNE